MDDIRASKAFAAYADCIGEDHATEKSFQDAFCGEWESEVAYAEELFNEYCAHEIPKYLRCYIDYEAFARDLFMDGCFSIENASGVYVFYNF